LFPDHEDRQRFVVDALEEALVNEEQTSEEEDTAVSSVGGTLHLFTDGGSRGNPGQAAIGVVLEDPQRGTTLHEHAERIGVETNNVAEYRALIEGLRIAQRFHPNRLICHLDSELIVKQLSGEYRVKMATLQTFVDEIQQLTMDFPDVVFKHIPRGDNHRADALVNKALDHHPTPTAGKWKPPLNGGMMRMNF
jgi:ribonuclease HI